MYEKYKHWEGYDDVWVRSDLKGKHREYCLCHNCKKFHPNPEGREDNCPIANEIYDICIDLGMTIPVWECPDFEQVQSKQLS